ncbi:MAG: ABC transporter ATP-binding protein [Solirubrobacteraceae bacterium]
MTTPLLEVRGLSLTAGRRPRAMTVLDRVSLEVHRGECVGLVGESGAGKSLTLRAVIGLLPAAIHLEHGEVLLEGRPYLPLPRTGPRIGMVFQEPQAALNPLMRAGDLIAEGLRTRGVRGAAARHAAIGLMQEVGIADPDASVRRYPHELSGGQRQRVAIAMVLAAEPAVLLCDEPTTALDVTVQERILELLDRLRVERNLAIVFVTHDIAVINRLASRVALIYAGRIVEQGPTAMVLSRPHHPYTARLLASLPRIDQPGRPLRALSGDPPGPGEWPQGCRFHPRCAYVKPDCLEAPFELQSSSSSRQSACIRWSEIERELERESL